MLNKLEDELKFPKGLEIEEGIDTLLTNTDNTEDEDEEHECENEDWCTFLEEVDKKDKINNLLRKHRGQTLEEILNDDGE